MLGGAAGSGGFMMPTGAAGAFVPGAPGFLGFDMSNPMAAGFNPFMFGFPQGGASMMPAAWYPGAGVGSASSFHAPGQKNEIKLFVGGLQF